MAEVRADTAGQPRRIVIAGGGSAGWMAAALFARLHPAASITLVESDAIGTIGVGEATVPILQQFNALLGLHEPDFIAATDGSFKLGIEFVGWGTADNRHFHGFGDHGADIEGIAPHHHWLRLRHAGALSADEAIDHWSMPAVAAAQDRFAPPQALSGPAAEFRHAYHFDAGLYARLLRDHATAAGVARVEGRIVDIVRDGDNGDVTALSLDGERRIEGDLFIDCTGFASLLLGRALAVPFVDWSRWLPCDRALALGTSRAGRFTPFTRSTAHDAGWQWRIPLQHRTGNGLVYSSAWLDDDAAAARLVAGVEGEPLGEPRLLRFTTGHRAAFWSHNVVAIGLSAGFIEPLESTGLQLIQTGLARLAELWPAHGPTPPAVVTEYNRRTVGEYARVRDFLVAHYAISRRPEPFWRAVAEMDLPDTLAHKLALWDAAGQVPVYDLESHTEASWVAILLGQGRIPHGHAPGADRPDATQLAGLMRHRRDQLARAAARMPDHARFVAQTCRATVG